MNTWKAHREHAMVICPLYQVPARSSQIYQQAITHNVCIFSFSHLALLTAYAEIASLNKTGDLLKKIFQVVDTLHPSKEANAYWQAINRTFLSFDDSLAALWRTEKLAVVDALQEAKTEALAALAAERSRILGMNLHEAVQALIQARKLDAQQHAIERFANNGLMEVA